MKKFFLFTGIIFAFTMLCIFMLEKTDPMGLSQRKLEPSFEETDGTMILSWKRLPYPCFYRIETYSHTTGLVKGEPEYHLFASEFTMNASYRIPRTAIPMYYRVSAYGMFGRLTGPSAPIANPNYPDPPVPIAIYHYTDANPASLMPFLVWHKVPTAVCYEVELLSGPPDAEGGTALSKKNHLESTRAIFTNGWQADLRSYQKQIAIYWRVRALGLHHEPIGEFSQAERIVIQPDLPMPDAPLINNFDQMPNFQQPIYPVYEWIPIHDMTKYEVELMIHPPKHPNNTLPDPERVWHMVTSDVASCYDEYARPYAGDYYWRVRAVDEDEHTIGHYSDAEHFVMPTLPARVDVVLFGDSIAHGGGALSYSPASLEYDITTYLDFPVWNLGRSGDTARMTLERFDTDVLPLHPKNLLILTGSNSLRSAAVSAEDVIEDLAEIERKCEKNDIRPIFLTLMPINPANIYFAFHTDTDPAWKEKLEDINDFLRKRPYHIDLEPYFYDPTHTVLDYHLAVDGLHPDLKGKMLIAEIINAYKNLLRE